MYSQKNVLIFLKREKYYMIWSKNVQAIKVANPNTYILDVRIIINTVYSCYEKLWQVKHFME